MKVLSFINFPALYSMVVFVNDETAKFIFYGAAAENFLNKIGFYYKGMYTF